MQKAPTDLVFRATSAVCGRALARTLVWTSAPFMCLAALSNKDYLPLMIGLSMTGAALVDFGPWRVVYSVTASADRRSVYVATYGWHGLPREDVRVLPATDVQLDRAARGPAVRFRNGGFIIPPGEVTADAELRALFAPPE